VSDQPPPPPPFPPPGGYGQQQPYGQGFSVGGGGSSGNLAEWPQRVLATLVDAGIIIAAEIVLLIVGTVLTRVVRPLGVLVLILSYIAVVGFFVLQLVKQGNTGQTIGKKVIGLKVLKEDTHQPVGAGMSVVRYLAHIVDSIICYIGWLFPLWDAKKQTIADKLMGTVVVTVPKQPFNIADLYTVA